MHEGDGHVVAEFLKRGQALREQFPGLSIVAAQRSQMAQVTGGDRDAALVPEPAEQCQGLLEQHLCPGLVAAEDEQHAEADLRVAKLARRQLLAAGDDHLPVPGRFLRMAAEPPVLPGHRAGAGQW